MLRGRGVVGAGSGGGGEVSVKRQICAKSEPPRGVRSSGSLWGPQWDGKRPNQVQCKERHEGKDSIVLPSREASLVWASCAIHSVVSAQTLPDPLHTPPLHTPTFLPPPLTPAALSVCPPFVRRLFCLLTVAAVLSQTRAQGPPHQC